MFNCKVVLFELKSKVENEKSIKKNKGFKGQILKGVE